MPKKNEPAKGVGASFLLAAAAAAGLYYLYGTEQGKKHRKKIEQWATHVRNDIEDQLDKLQYVNKEAYHQLVDTVVERYKSIRDFDSKELDTFVKELKGHWKQIQKQIPSGKLRKKK